MNTGEGTALSNWSPLGRQPNNPNLDRTPVAPRLGYEVVYPVATSWIKPCPLQRERGGLASTAAMQYCRKRSHCY